MTDYKFTDDEVIHHLDCYENSGCRWCGYAITIINRQKAEIERLTTLAELGNMRANDYRAMRDKLKAANAEIEMLQKTVEDMTEGALIAMNVAKAEAVKEFAERLKAEMSFGRYIQADQIDNLVNEIIGE